MNELLYSELNDNFEYFKNINNYNSENYSNYSNNNNYNTLKNLDYIYNEDTLDKILLCNKSKKYILKKIFDNDILLKIIFKIRHFDNETIITLLMGMLIILIINIILKYTKNIFN